MHHALLKKKNNLCDAMKLKKLLLVWILINKKLDSSHLTACLTDIKFQFYILNSKKILKEYCDPNTQSQQKQQHHHVNFD